MLDKIPAWARHLVIVVATAVLTVVGQAVANGGVSSIDWKNVLNAAVAAGVTYGLLALTPLTQQYGVGAAVAAPEPPAAPPGF